jgi:putative intracellular protease/amidase
MRTAYLRYDRFTALDVAGPYEVLASVPGAESVFVAEGPGSVRSDREALAMVAGHALAGVGAADVVVVPGGLGTRRLLDHERVSDWLRRAHETTAWTTSVCTGSCSWPRPACSRRLRQPRTGSRENDSRRSAPEWSKTASYSTARSSRRQASRRSTWPCASWR